MNNAPIVIRDKNKLHWRKVFLDERLFLFSTTRSSLAKLLLILGPKKGSHRFTLTTKIWWFITETKNNIHFSPPTQLFAARAASHLVGRRFWPKWTHRRNRTRRTAKIFKISQIYSHLHKKYSYNKKKLHKFKTLKNPNLTQCHLNSIVPYKYPL